ncbi:MAG: TlpA family protein disulfide reductase [Halobacteriovoraceae bacterium]|nr:TlpA family protein disulfide reductase [Halobacteriovoraceae bacterium]
MFRNCVSICLITLFVSACSLRSEDVLLKIEEISQGRDYYNFDEKYILETKKLRDRNPKSLNAHAAYIAARRGSKAMIAEYMELVKSESTPLHKYLSLRAELTGIHYRKKKDKKEIIEKLEALVVSNKVIEEEGMYDLSKLRGFDKAKRKDFGEKLYKMKPTYLPYQHLYSQNLKAADSASEIIEFCKKGLVGKKCDVDLCSNLSDINEQTGKEFIPQRDELVEVMTKKALASSDRDDWKFVFSLLSTLSENSGNTKLKANFVTKILKKDPSWLPYEVYRKYYGDIKYGDFEIISQIGKINKKLDFKERIKDFEKILDDTSLIPKLKADVHANMGYAYLNPANENKEKAYKHLTLSHKIDPGSFYLISNLLELILELNKDSDIGLMLIEEAMDETLKKTEEMGTGEVAHTMYLFDPFERTLSSWNIYKGRLLMRQKKDQEAKVAFLESFQATESEEAAYFLGKLYSKTNPMLAMEFLGLSLKNKSEQNPIKEEYAKDRKNLLSKIYKKYYSKELNEETLLSLYKDKVEDSKEEVHPFVGKDILTQDIEDFRGGKFDWNKLKGKKVILSFWATWCTPCFQEMAVLNKIQKEGNLPNLKIVGVCTDGIAQKRKVKKILKEGGIDFEILLDDGTFRDKYLVSGIPSMFFLNEKNKFIKQKTGYSPKLEKDIFKIFN